MATTVGELNVKLNIEMTRLEAQIQQANRKISGMSKTWDYDIKKAAKAINGTLASIGVGASLSGLIAFGKSTMDMVGQIVDLSAQAGIGTDAFQNFNQAAKENGATGEQVASSFSKLRNAIDEAASGNKAFANTFDKLNLSGKEMKGMGLDVGMVLFARALAKVKDEQERYNLASQAFGEKIGPKMMQFFDALANGGLERAAEAIKGVRLTPEQLKTLDDANDKLAEMYDKLRLFSAGTYLSLTVSNPEELEHARAQIADIEAAITATSKRNPVNSDKIILGLQNELKYWKEIEASAAKTSGADRGTRGPGGINAGATAEPAMNTAALAEAERLNAAAAEQSRLDALNLEIVKATTAAEKDEAEAKKANDAYATAYNKTLSETDQKMRGYADAAMSAIDPSHGLAKEIEGIQAAADYGVISVENATAAIDKLTEAAGEADLDSFLAGMNAEYADEIKAVNKEAREMKRLADDIGDAFGDSFQSAIMDGGKVGDMLKSLGRDILALIVRQSITSPIAGLVSGGISSMFGGLFGGGSSWGGAAAGMNTWQGATNFGGYAATGGDVNPSEWYMVGEKGPEPFIPSTAGTIVSNSDLMSALGAERGGGTSITVVQNFAAGVSQSQLAESMRQTREAAKSGVMDAIQRRGGGFGMVAA